MKRMITWKRSDGNTTQGESITFNVTLSSFVKDEIDDIQKLAEKYLGYATVTEGNPSQVANSTAFKLLEEVETLESQLTALRDLMWDLGCFDGCFTDKPSVIEVLSMSPEEFRK